MPSVRFDIDASGATRGAEQWSRATDRIVAEARRAAQAVEQMDRALRSTGQGNIGREFERVAAQFQRVPNAIRPAVQQVGSFSLAMRDMSSASALAFGPLSGLGSRFTAVGSLASRSSLALGGTIAVATGIGVAFGAAVKQAADFEQAMLRVAKVTNATSSELRVQSADVLKLSSALGVPAGELAKIEESAARLGIRGSQNLATFAGEVAKLTRTTDLGADQLSTQLAQFLNLTKSAPGEVTKVSAAITALGNNFAASEGKIISMALELARGASAFNIGSEKLLALSASLAAVGERSERSGTALTQVLIGITQAAAGGKHLDDFARLLGVTNEQFQKLAKQDVGQVFIEVLKRLQQEGPQAINVLQQLHLGSSRNFKVLLTQAQAIDEVGRALGIVRGQYANATATDQEFERMNDAVNRQLEVAGVRLANLGTLLGNTFLPAINGALQGLNEFLGVLQGVTPAADQASGGVKQAGDQVQHIGEVSRTAAEQVVVLKGTVEGLFNLLRSVGALIITTFDPLSHLPFVGESESMKQFETSLERLRQGLNTTFQQINALEHDKPINLFDDAAKDADDARAISSAVSTLTGNIQNATRAPDALSAAMANLSKTNEHTTVTFDKSAEAVKKALAAMDGDIAAKRALATQGEAAAKAQEEINKLTEKGYTVTQADRAAILAKAQTLVGLTNGTKAAAKEAKDASKAFETFSDGVAKVFRDLEKDIKLTGLTDSQKEVVEFTEKIKELGAKAIEGGEDEVKIRDAVNAAIARGIPLLNQSAEAKAKEFNSETLQSLQRQVELRHIEIEQGAAAARVQEIINDAKDKGIALTTEEVSQYRKLSDELDGLHDKSTVVADAFEDFIAGIAQGTQDLSLDGIADAFKAAFAASVKEKLKFDDIFKGNMFDLVSYAGELFSGGVIDVANLFSFGGGGGGGGGGGSILKNLLGGNGGGLFAGSSTGLLFSALGAGIGAGGAHGSYGTVTGIGANLLFQGAGQLLMSNLGQDALALLGGETFAGTVGNFFGNELGTWFGQAGVAAFGSSGGSVAGSFGGGIGGSIGSAGVSAVLGIGASFAGQATANAMGIRPLYGTEGQIHMAIGNTVAQIIGNYFGGPIGGFILQYINEILQPLLFGALGIAAPPLKGTLQRQQGESVLDSLPVFADLQKKIGDLTRGNYRVSDQPGLVGAREKLGPDALEAISGFAGIFSEKFLSNWDDGGRVAGLTEEWTNIFTDFFGRLDVEGKEAATAIKQYLAQAFKEAGIDATDAMEVVNDLAGDMLWSPGGKDTGYFGEEVSNVKNLGEAVRGTAAIFESEMPKGVHIAALAMESMSRDGEKAFGDLDTTGHETLVNLSRDAENFDAILAHLYEQGFTIDTTEFEARLKAITQSAGLLNNSLGGIFDASTFEQGFSSVLNSLKSDIKQKLGGGFIAQLFDKTNIAAAFEPVYALLDRMDEFDLSSSGGLKDFMALLGPAIAEGRANLEDYLPILKEMYAQWKDIEKQVDDALAPTKAEMLADAIGTAFGGLGSLVGQAIESGVAVLNSGGTMDEALRVFNSKFGTSLQTTLKTAVFNAILDTAIIQPLIARYQPAFQYVAMAGLALGFSDPRVLAAWNDLMSQVENDVARVGPLLLQSAADTNGLDHGLTKFFARMKEDIDQINQNLASTFTSTIGSAITEAMKSGKAVDLDELRDNLHATIYEAVVNAMVEAMVSAAIIQGGLAPMLEQLKVMSADAWKDGVLDAGEKATLTSLITQIGKAGIELTDVMIAGLAPIIELIGGLPGVNVGGKKNGHYETRNGDIVFVEDGPSGTPDPNEQRARRSIREEGRSETDIGIADGGRQVIEQGVKPATDAFADLITGTMIPSLKDLDDTVGDVTTGLDALQRLLRGASGAPAPAPSDDTTTTPGRRIPGHAAGGSFRVGQEAMFITGERGPELFIAHGNGYEVIPLSGRAASAMLGGGMTGYASGTPVTKPGHGDTPPEPRGKPYYPPGFYPRGGVPGDGLHRPWPDGPSAKSKYAIDVQVNLGIDDAIRDFLTGGSLKDFEDALDEATKKSVLDGVIKGLLEAGPIKNAIDAFNKQMGDAVEKAMRDGVVDATEQASLDALAAKLTGGIENAAKQMQPVVSAVTKALGLDAAHEVDTGVRDALEKAFRDFATSGDTDAANEAIRKAFNEAALNGIIDALLAKGPIADAIEKASTSFGDAFRDAMEDGVISEDEAQRLHDLGVDLGENLQTAFAGLDPAITALFDGMKDKAAAAMQQAGEIIGGSLKGLLNDPKTLNFRSFTASLRQAIYQDVAGGLIDAFVKAAIVQGAMAPMLAAIQAIFEQIGKHQISIAEANSAIATQIALMLDVLKDPTFKAAIDTILKGVTDLGKQLGQFPSAAQDVAGAAGAVSDAVSQAQEDVCAGKCGLKEETVNLGQTVLDASGRIADVEDVVYRAFGGDGAAAAGGIPNTYGGGNDAYGWNGSDADWRHRNRWIRRENRDRRNGGPDWEPGYYGTPPPGPDPWMYDPNIPRMADGGIVTAPTLLVAGEAGAEAIVPLGDLGDNSDLVALIEEMRDEVKELREALASQPVVVKADVKVDETKVIEVMAKAKRSAKAAGFSGV